MIQQLDGARTLPREADDIFAGDGEMAARMRAMDWAATPLGPVSRWPQSLKTCVRIVLTSRQPMFVWWGDALINLYNDAYRAIVGGKHPAALGQPASEVWREIWDQVGPRAASAMRLNEGTYDEALLLIMERHGYPEETYYTFSYSPVPNDEGGTGGILCANTDDTGRIIGERQLALLRELGARSSDARTVESACRQSVEALATNPWDLPFALLYLVDADGKGMTLAGAAGVEGGAPVAPRHVPFDHPKAGPVGEAVRSLLPTMYERVGEMVSPVPHGAWPRPPQRALMIPLGVAGGSGPTGLLSVGLNPFRLFDANYERFVTLVAGQIAASLNHAHAYEQEKRRAEELAAIDRAKTAFFSNVSHEFRTPLTLMVGPTEDALASPERALRGPELETVHRNQLRLLKLVNSLLDFSRIEAGRMGAAYEPTDLAALTKDLASAFRSAIERGGLSFAVECGPLSGPVHVDRDMWEKIVLNLLSNAFKFTFEGGIRVRLREAGERVELEVRDTGVGIAEAELPRIFERFHRIEGTRARTHEGTGIGLALVDELVRMHGGTIRAESRPGEGSCFTVSLPRGTSHLRAEQLGESRSLVRTQARVDGFVSEALRWLPGTGAEEASLAAPPLPVAPGRVLVADDNADMRDYVARLLRPHWQVEVASNGLEALEAARRTRPDLVLTDVMMPELDGFGLLRALRTDPKTAGIAVVMLSARAGEESRVEGLAAGADDYLVKPFAARELLARVATHLEIARLRRTAELERGKLSALFEQAPAGICVLSGPDHVYQLANPPYLRLTGRTDIVGLPVREALPEVVDQGFIRLLDDVYRTGNTFIGREVPVRLARGSDGALDDGYYDFVYQAFRGAGGEVEGILVFVYEVTAQVRARRAVEQAEARFRRIFESSMVGFLYTNRDGRVHDANDYLLDLIGYTREDVTSGRMRWVHLIPPEYAAQTEDAARQLEATGVLAPTEKEYFRKDGSRVPVVIGSTRVPGSESDNITFVLDLSSRKRVERQLAFLAEASTALASSLDRAELLGKVTGMCGNFLGGLCAVYLLDEGGRLSIAASHFDDPPRHEELRRIVAGLNLDEVAESGPGFVLRHARSLLVRDVTAESQDTATREPVLRARMRELGMRSKMLVPLTAEGRTFGVMIFALFEGENRFDESDLRLAEEIGRRTALAIEAARLYGERTALLAREQEARAQAEEANRTKDEFLAMLGHELRNPLAPILTALHLMQLRGRDGADRERTIIERQVQHLVRLVDDLLDVSRITRGRVELKKQRLELAEVVAKGLEMASPLFEQRGHHLSIEVPRLGLAVEGDAARLAQVVSNLLANAAKYTERGGQVSVSAARVGRDAELRVKDNGIGIDPQMLPKVFDMFVQERQSLDRSQGGLGLGLAIVRSLVQLHGGSVSAASEGRGKGSEFVLRLPLCAAVAEEELAPGTPPPATTGGSGGRRILVVDDNEDAAEVIADCVSMLGHETRVAHDGPAALRLVAEFAPELALLDIGLPVMDGYELARRIRALPGQEGLKLVALTGYGQESDRRRSQEAGFDRHLVKPVSFEMLENLLEAAFPQSKAG